ncbi:hypothetical protein Aperf_G00000036330 [Anoplocephala perfoliata]
MSLTSVSDEGQSSVLSNDGLMHDGISLSCSQSNNSSSRIIYPREELLKYKESESSRKGFDDESICTNSKVLLKILKPGCKSLEKNLKPYYNNGIVLGPQKRSWNNGCHVSQVKRSQNDSFTKGNKGANENKFARVEYKRDSKGNSGRFTTTGSGSSFTRGSALGKDGSTFKHRSTDSFNENEAEPEWFTEGPETINDTVELGLSIDDGDIKPESSSKPKETAKPNPSDIDSAILSLDKDFLPSQEPSKPSKVTEADLLKLLSFPKKTTSEGSRILKFLDNPSPERAAQKTNAEILSSTVDDSSSFALKFPLAEAELPTANAQSSPSTTSQPSALDLSTILRDLVLGGTSSSSLKSLDVPKVSSKSSLFSSVPSVGQIEAAALIGTTPNLPNCTCAPEQSSRGHSIFEPLQHSDNSLGSSRPRYFDPYAHSNITNWVGSAQGNNMMVNSPGDNALNDQLLLMGAFDRLPSRQMNASSRNLPNDPAIAHQFSQRRSAIPNICDIEQKLPAQNRQAQQLLFQQSPFYHPNYRSATPNSNFHSSPSMEAALSQLKGSFGAHQNPITPPNSLFSSSATLRGGSGNSSSNQLERIFNSMGRGIVPPMEGFYISQHQPPQMCQNGSAPNLLPPTANPTSAIDMFLSNHENSGFGEVHFSSRPRPTTIASDMSSAQRGRLS